ncbi:AI-2E family transporter [Streptomyces cyaneochromogenes]|uniref:AI-2E family transporter n=1 Tax=Streptomyces cyaneochromogenes TaxID=2496836 RepID=A0A3S9LZK4_9ACTN|nr:AI-2E family transporter [Streptomyces cyaneochromogenes]AZQ32358.1 AI-2E family transporter [Streptomyces cyaneochromogenes]
MSTPSDPPAAPLGRPSGAETRVPGSLRTAAAYAWRIIAVGVVVRAAFSVLGQFHRIAVAVFLGLVVTAVLRPVAGLLARFLPRPLAVAAALVGGIAVVLGALALVGEIVAGQRTGLEKEFVAGIDRIERRLQEPPFRLSPDVFNDLQSRIGKLLSSHRSALVSEALSGASRLLEVLTVLALALFCAVFFTHSGDRQWQWLCDQLPARTRQRFTIAGRAAWRTFTGYTHGILLVAATNAVLVGIALSVLRVPLAVPLALLEFLAAFIPLIGSPIALAVAAVVALATKGPVIALLVVVLIVVIGQIEGHLLHPIVMSWAVRLHPVVVALAVVGGAVAAGVIGAVVAVPLVAVLWSVRQALRGRTGSPDGGEEGGGAGDSRP